MESIDLIYDYKMRTLSKEDCKDLEDLCTSCSDYYILHSGLPPAKEDAVEIFTSLPPHKHYEDKSVFGVYKSGKKLVGVIDIVRDFPVVGQWMLGLMLLDPLERGNGLGRTIHQALVQWAVPLGAESFRIGVIEENKNGFRFWSSLGYKGKKQVSMDIGKKTHVVNVMTLRL